MYNINVIHAMVLYNFYSQTTTDYSYTAAHRRNWLC